MNKYPKYFTLNCKRVSIGFVSGGTAFGKGIEYRTEDYKPGDIRALYKARYWDKKNKSFEPSVSFYSTSKKKKKKALGDND